MESWKSVDEYPNYEVSTLGRVRRGEKMLKAHLNNWGYYDVYLSLNNAPHKFKVHRLVALAFIPNPDSKKEVDHINRIRSDNRVENLRWTTHSENIINTPNRSQHRQIIQRGNLYRVRICRNNKIVFSESYYTLEEAIAGRDAFFTTSASSCHAPCGAVPSGVPSGVRRHTAPARPVRDGSPMPCG